MVEKKIDRRILRTRQKIKETFAQLMEEKGFEAMTVRDLTERADINRGTFYLHYLDKYDLLEKSEDELFEDMEKIADEVWGNLSLNQYDQVNLDEPFPFIIQLFEYMEENYEFIRVLLGPNGNSAFQVRVKEVIKKKMLEKFLRYTQPEKMLVPMDYLVSYVSSAHLGVIQQWLGRGMDRTPQEMALLLSNISNFGPAYVAGLKEIIEEKK
ncbi:TetR/AcrR family transcriptional regulator [Sporosarcina sp. BI001-red]|uniref:TetR/AcrR family transcriptional regulator n=1 Tax=Sporosarcina sp. BI001-red TaxID=2282866 RepID=UPI000E26EA2F|nr:TetR/AcrR family transcriptional regulator [Sporosarcina sp. BI001-red]REB05569.1 TetR/AcrR family transcriptional regulator [Sporosarcina sp. BI001-red]